MNRFKQIVVWLVVSLIIALSALNVYLTLSLSHRNNQTVQEFRERMSKIESQPLALNGINGINGIDGYTPVKGIDYFDGTNGKDSVSTHITETIIKEVPVNGTNGVDGLTPELRCNVGKNRWEYRYVGDSLWKVLNGTPVKCTIKEAE